MLPGWQLFSQPLVRALYLFLFKFFRFAMENAGRRTHFVKNFWRFTWYLHCGFRAANRAFRTFSQGEKDEA